MENEKIYSAILDAVKVNEQLNVLTTAAEEKLSSTLHYASTLSQSDNRQEKLKRMGDSIALAKFLKIISYVKGEGVPSSVLENYEKHLEYILAVLR